MLSIVKKYRLPLKNCIDGILPFFGCFFSLVINKPNPFGPLISMVIPTYRCNCQCSYCALEARKNLGEELNRAEILELANQIGRTKIQLVHISGGEPFLKEEIFEFIRILKDYHKVVFIDTNGILLEKYISEIMQSGIDFIGISFESHKPQVCNQLKGFDNAFEKAIKGIDLIKKVRKGRYPVVDIKGLISRLNFKELGQYIEYFSKIGDYITFQPVQNNLIHPNRYNSICFSNEDEKDFRGLFNDLVKKHNFLNNNYYKLMPDFIFNPEGLLQSRQFRCLLPAAFSLSIQPWGEVALCLGRDETIIGNIKESDLMQLWRNKKTFMIQRMLRNEKKNCVCWTANNQQLSQLLAVLKLI